MGFLSDAMREGNYACRVYLLVRFFVIKACECGCAYKKGMEILVLIAGVRRAGRSIQLCGRFVRDKL